MRQEQYEQYRNAKNQDPMLAVGSIPDATRDRTLIYGFHCDTRHTIHSYLEAGEIHILTYNSDQVTISHQHGTSVPISDMLPSKRAYPEACDYETSLLIASRGFDISFTTFNPDREEAVFYGKRKQDLVPTAPNILEMRELLSQLRNQVRDRELKEIEEDLYNDNDSYTNERLADQRASEKTEPLRVVVVMALNNHSHELWTDAMKAQYQVIKRDIATTGGEQYAKSLERFEELAQDFGVAF
ncbi:MAG: hypothetical protein RSG77_21810 [Hafnia sp.]